MQSTTTTPAWLVERARLIDAENADLRTVNAALLDALTRLLAEVDEHNEKRSWDAYREAIALTR